MSHTHDWKLVTVGALPIREIVRHPEGFTEEGDVTLGIMRSYRCACGATRAETSRVPADSQEARDAVRATGRSV